MSDAEFISKSQKKREMHSLQSVGEELLVLSPDELKRMSLPEELLVAVLDAKRIGPSKHTAMKRQRQYIGRLMREIDPAPIVEHLDRLKGKSALQTAALHSTEQWRERLLKDERGIDAFLAEFPTAPAAQLRELIAATLSDRAHDRPPKHFRELYRAVHVLVEEKIRRQP